MDLTLIIIFGLIAFGVLEHQVRNLQAHVMALEGRLDEILNRETANEYPLAPHEYRQ